MPLKVEISEQVKIKAKKPKNYKVLMYNDDFTPMDFVVEILIGIFNKSEEEAVAMMLTVHQGDYAVVGIYTYDIAHTKAAAAVKKAREEGYPLRVRAEEA